MEERDFKSSRGDVRIGVRIDCDLQMLYSMSLGFLPCELCTPYILSRGLDELDDPLRFRANAGSGTVF